MDEQLGTSWMVVNGDLWPRLSKSRRYQIKVWLEMNGINPSYVPVDTEILLILQSADLEEWVIRYEEFRTDEDGHVIHCTDRGGAYADEREVPLIIDPPVTWLTPL